MACGGTITTAYFELLNLQISEFIFHTEVLENARQRMNPSKGTANNMIGGDIEWI